MPVQLGRAERPGPAVQEGTEKSLELKVCWEYLSHSAPRASGLIFPEALLVPEPPLPPRALHQAWGPGLGLSPLGSQPVRPAPQETVGPKGKEEEKASPPP